MKTVKKFVISLLVTAISVSFGIGSAFAYSDVSSSHKYFEAISYISDQGIVSGYADGTYKPNQTINRAELLKILVESSVPETESAIASYANQKCFTDVPAGEWFTGYVCLAKNYGWVNGYSDGSFKPAQTVTFVEALKMAMEVLDYPYSESSPWYRDLVDMASIYNFIPLDVTAFEQQFNRGQMAELMTRMLKYSTGGATALNEYLGDLLVYVVTYASIEMGMNVEDQADVDSNGPAVCPDIQRICEDGSNAEPIQDSCDFYCPEDDFVDPEPDYFYMSISSSAFDDGGNIDEFYTCDGYDVNPPLTITNPNYASVSFVLFVDDYFAADGIFNHWVVWNIDPFTTEIEQDSVPTGAVQGTNDFGNIGYNGPCPPLGKTHTYTFYYYGLSQELDLPEGSTAQEVEDAMAPYVLDSASLTGVYY